MEKVIITTMCLIVNEHNQILFIDRNKSWSGLALPGGHLETSESILECVKREIFEETGLVLLSLQFKGLTHFFNPELDERYLVFNFKSDKFEGDAKELCDEGSLQWIPKDSLNQYKFAEGMEIRFDLFFDETITEMFVEWTEKDGYKKLTKKNMQN